jgi:hypothetical protein
MVVKMFILGRRCVHTNVMKFLLQIFLKGKRGLFGRGNSSLVIHSLE